MGYQVKAYTPGGALMHSISSGDLFMVRGLVSSYRSQGLSVVVSDSSGNMIPV